MPYAILAQSGCFKVTNTTTGKVHAECTTRAKAEAQVRLLRGIEAGTLKPRDKK